LWFQLYLGAELLDAHQLLKRAGAAGFEALIVTVDAVVSGNREYNKRNGYAVPLFLPDRCC